MAFMGVAFWQLHFAWVITVGMWLGAVGAFLTNLFGSKLGSSVGNCTKCRCPGWCHGKSAFVVFSPVAFATGLWLVPAGGLMSDVCDKGPVDFLSIVGGGAETHERLEGALKMVIFVLLVLLPTACFGFRGCESNLFGTMIEKICECGICCDHQEASRGPGMVFRGIVAHCVPDAMAMAGICRGLGKGDTGLAPAMGYAIEMGILNFDEVLNAYSASKGGLCANVFVVLTVFVPGLIMGIGPGLVTAGLESLKGIGAEEGEKSSKTGEAISRVSEYLVLCIALVIWFKTWYDNAARWFGTQLGPASGGRTTVYEEEGDTPAGAAAEGESGGGGTRRQEPIAFHELFPVAITEEGADQSGRGGLKGDLGATEANRLLRARETAATTFVQWVMVGLFVTMLLIFVKPTIEKLSEAAVSGGETVDQSA